MNDIMCMGLIVDRGSLIHVLLIYVGTEKHTA